MPTRQRRRPTSVKSPFEGSGAGKGVDFLGGPVIDPTENVLALVDAEAKHRDDLRAADARYFDAMREAETKRVDDLAKQKSEHQAILTAQKDAHDARIAEMLRLQTQGNSELVAKQLDRIMTTYDSRIAAVERSQYESGGKATVMDPAVSEALKSIANLRGTERVAHGRTEGQGQIIAWLVAAAAVGGFLFDKFGGN